MTTRWSGGYTSQIQVQAARGCLHLRHAPMLHAAPAELPAPHHLLQPPQADFGEMTLWLVHVGADQTPKSVIEVYGIVVVVPD